MASGDVTPKILSGTPPLYYGVQLDTVDTVIVEAGTAPTNLKTIKQIVICNTTSAQRLVTIGINGTDPDKAIMYDFPVAAYDTVTFDTTITLEPYDMGPSGVFGFLAGVCDNASAVTVMAFGWETEA